MKKIGKSEGSTLQENPKHKIKDRTKQIALWDLSDDPALTIPNLEDSVEQMLARQRAGLRDRGFDSDGHRYYPIDPTSLTTAEKVVTRHKAELEQKLKDQEAFLVSEKKRREDMIKAQEEEKAAFEAFKQRNISTVKESK